MKEFVLTKNFIFHSTSSVVDRFGTNLILSEPQDTQCPCSGMSLIFFINRGQSSKNSSIIGWAGHTNYGTSTGNDVGKSAEKILYWRPCQTRSEIREVLKRIAFWLLENFRFLSSTIQASCLTSLQPPKCRKGFCLWIVGKFLLLKQKPLKLKPKLQN